MRSTSSVSASLRLDRLIPAAVSLLRAARAAAEARRPDVVLVGAAGRGVQFDLNDFGAPTLAGDLAERDFTVNALAVPLGALLAVGRAAIVDPTGGLADLRARRLRPPGPRVLTDEPLRALRVVRLEAGPLASTCWCVPIVGVAYA